MIDNEPEYQPGLQTPLRETNILWNGFHIAGVNLFRYHITLTSVGCEMACKVFMVTR